MSSPIYIEEELGRKWDKCLSDSVIKFGKFQIKLAYLVNLLCHHCK